MSGTSLDGLDMALCTFTYENSKWSYSIEQSQTIKFPKDLEKRLKGAFDSTAAELAMLNTDFGRYLGETAKEFLDKYETTPDLIASHGHTVFHEPDKGYTLQIGSGAEIAAKSGVLTICDFRSLDVSLGGQGAPLVPIGDELLFGEYDAYINLGGFANISYKDDTENRIAFDICPLNFVLNRLAGRLGLPFDYNGETAKTGEIIPDLLEKLNGLDFYEKSAPKSLGQEWVQKEIMPLLDWKSGTENLLRTISEHVAIQLETALSSVLGNQVLVTGGGACNDFLMKLLSEKTNKKLVVPQSEIIKMKEAIIFAFLGVLRYRGEANCLASVTGAKRNNCGGRIYLPG